MSTEYLDPRVSFFDDLAERWDGFEDLQALAGRLAEGLRHFQVRPDERILEVGCGTGNLTSALCRHLSQAGRIVAVDCSARMLERARAKVTDGRVTWIHAHLQDLPRDGAAFDGVAFDRAILMGVWPHLGGKGQVLESLHGQLRPGGMLHLWHIASRARINQIHSGGHPSIAQDMLEPASEISELLTDSGFEVLDSRDDETQHFVTARRN